MSVSGKGIHPYIGIAYSDKQNDSSFDDIERTRVVNINAGMVCQPDLGQNELVKPFVGFNLGGCLISSTISLTNATQTSLRENYIYVDRDYNDYKIETLIKPGFVVKTDDRLAVLYLLGIGQYEWGEFYDFREKVDGIGNIYNMAGERFTYGFGLGGEYQMGIVDEYDVGFSCEVGSLFNITQSIAFEDRDQNIDELVVYGKGDFYRMNIYKFGPYIDFKKLRADFSYSSMGKYIFQITYRL